MSAGRLLKRTCPHLLEEECAAYDAPFPDINYKAGVRRFPEIVPDRSDSPGAELSRRAREWLRSKWTGPVFMAIGMKDPVLGPPVMHALRNDIRSCPAPYEHSEAGHFVQEWGEEIARRALAAFDKELPRSHRPGALSSAAGPSQNTLEIRGSPPETRHHT
jgi:pimeloyl-ACP methyl ester carboxylesterase